MKPFDVKIEKSMPVGERLPVGAYVAEIKKAEVISYSWGDVLLVSFDIADGKYKGHFAADYRNSTRSDKKWKGTHRLTVPQPENQWYDNQKRAFGDALYCLQESNPGYKWDWDESKLRGKKIGVLFREEEWDDNGETKLAVKCCRFLTVGDVKSGNFKIPKPKLLKKAADPVPAPEPNQNIFEAIENATSAQESGNSFAEVPEEEEDLPF